ncbi:MAG: hypothetical protein HQ541_17615 [Mariniphaga sp.]|nr:hypothetical protein [Mariniphaga sp.]
MKKTVLITVFAILAASVNVIAQADTNEGSHSVSISIPQVALLDLEGTSSFTLEPTPPAEAGNPFDFSTATNNNVWINYSSIVASGSTRTVSASITTGTIPSGLELKVTTGSASATGNGTKGSPSSQITLSGTAQTIISGIESCWTGNGASNGHNLTYQLDLTGAANYGLLVETNPSVTVTYTITDVD